MSAKRNKKSAGHLWLLAHVNYRGTDCLLWPFAIVNNHGQFTLNYVRHYASTFMCEMAHGPAPSPQHRACLSCTGAPCVNPRHLSWQTRTDQRRRAAERQGADMLKHIAALIPAAFPREMRDDILQDVALAVIEGGASMGEMPAAISAAIKRYRKLHPGKFGPISLDAPIAGTDGLRLIDVLAA